MNLHNQENSETLSCAHSNALTPSFDGSMIQLNFMVWLFIQCQPSTSQPASHSHVINQFGLLDGWHIQNILVLQISISNCHCTLSEHSYTVYVLCDNEHTTHRVGIRASTQFSQEWVRRKVVVKHSIKSNQMVSEPQGGITLSSCSGVVCLEHVLSITLLDLLSIGVFFYVMQTHVWSSYSWRC